MVLAVCTDDLSPFHKSSIKELMWCLDDLTVRPIIKSKRPARSSSATDYPNLPFRVFDLQTFLNLSAASLKSFTDDIGQVGLFPTPLFPNNTIINF